ncbi:MAG: hypothetical protein ACRCUY_03675 [Thermoguttaceae bacterium]
MPFYRQSPTKNRSSGKTTADLRRRLARRKSPIGKSSVDLHDSFFM